MGPVRMKTLHINTEWTWRGGEQQVIYLVQGLLRRGDETLLVCQPKSPIARKARELGIPHIPLRMIGEVDLFAAARLADILRREKVSVVHIHTPLGHTLALLAAPFCGWPRLIVSKRTDFSIFRNSFFGLNLLKYAYGIHRYIAISEAVKRVLVKDGVPAGRISVVRSCVDPDRLARGSCNGLRAELGIREDGPIVGNVGHMTPHKGQGTLIEAIPKVLQEVPAARFVIVGEGALEPSLKGQARRLGVSDRITFPGFRKDIPSFLSLFQVFVMPSHMEGLGTAILDALAMGLPVVATTAGGIPEMVKDGKNGLLVPPGDPEALSRAIISLLEDPKRARSLGRAGFDTVSREFSLERMVEQTRQLYREVLDG